MARQPTAAAAVLGVLVAVALSADGIHGQLAQQNAAAADRLGQSSSSDDMDGEPELIQLAPSADRTPTFAAAGPPDSQGSALPIPDSAPVQTLYTTFTFIDRFVKDDKPVAITNSETISRLTSLAPGQVAPSGTTRRTETFLTTYTYYKTESAITEGGRPRITSTEEVTTQVVVTEAARLPAIVSRPAAVRPVVLATVPPQQLPQAPLVAPTVEPSLSTDGTGVRNSVVMAATRTFYTTSTFYTTLVESGSTVVRSRTELTSRIQTELTTTWLQLAPSAVRPLVSQTVTWLGQSGQQQQQAPVRQAAVAAATGAEADDEKNSESSAQSSAQSLAQSSAQNSAQSSAQSTEGNAQASESATEGASEEDKNAVLLAIQTLVAEADKENMAADPAASAPAALIPDTIISAPGSGTESAQMTAESSSSVLSNAGVEAPAVVPEPVAKPISKKPQVTKVTSEVKPLASKVKSTSKPTKTQTPPPNRPTKPQAQTSNKPTKSQTTNLSKPTKPQAASPSKPVKAQTDNKPVKPQAPTPSQVLVAPAPVAVPSPPTSTVETSVQTSTSTSVSESSALSPGLGGLAGGLLGLGGLAAGLIRNVIPLPLPLRRDGSSGVPPGGSPFQRPRPGGRPGIRPGPRPIRPGLRPQGGNRRHQTLANRNDNGYLVVVGPGGQRIHLNRAPESGHTPPTRRTGHLAGIPPRSGAPGGVQAPPPPQRRPGFHSGAPVRRVDRPRRPQTVSRPLTRIPSRIDGPPPRRGVRPGRPSRPQGRPHGRPVGPNHLHRPGRPVSRRPRPHPTGYIAVRPGDPTPPSDFQRQPTQFRQPVHGDTTRPEQHRHTRPVHRPQSDAAAHASPSHPQHGAVRPPPQHAGPGKNQSPHHSGGPRQPHQQHVTSVRPATSNHVGGAGPPPTQHTGAVRPPPVRQHVANGRPPIRHPQGSVRPQLHQHPKPIRRPHPSHAQANGIHGDHGSLQNRPLPTGPVVPHPSSIDVPASGNTAPHSGPETLYREHFVKAPELQADALVFKSEINGSPHPVPGNARVTSQLPSYQELNNGVDQEPSDDQKSSASLFTNIGPDGEVQRNPEDIVRVVTAPAHAVGQEAPAVQANPILVPTLHTIASVEGPNRIVGTNVFKQVGPLSTLETLELVTDNVPAPLQPSQVTKNIQPTQTVGVLSPFAGTGVGGAEPSLSLGPISVGGTDPTPESVDKEHSLQGSFTGHNDEYDTGSDNPQSQGFGSHVSETTRPHFGQKVPTPDGTATTPILSQGVSNSDNSRPFFENTDAFGSSATQEEPVYPDDAEDQYASSTNDDSIGNDRESDYNSLANANAVPSAPSLPGLAGIGFEQLPVTVPPTVKTESPDQTNALEENAPLAPPQYEDEEGLNPTIGYDYSVPQYDPALENYSPDKYPGSSDDAKPFGSATLGQSNDDDGHLSISSARDPEVLSYPGKPVPTASTEDDSNIGSFNDGEVREHGEAASSGHDKEGGVSAWTNEHGDNADGFVGSVEQGNKPVDSTWTNSPAENAGTGQSASSEGAAVEIQVNSQWTDQGQGDRDVTLPPSDETALPLWNQSPVGESEDNTGSVQGEEGLHATPTSPYETFGRGDDSLWNKKERPTESIWSDRQPGKSDDSSKDGEQTEEILNDLASANGQLSENGNPVPTNGPTNVQNVAFGAPQQNNDEESVLGKQQESNGGKTSNLNSEYEPQGSSQNSGSSSNWETSPVPNGLFTVGETGQSPFVTHSIQEQDSATEKTSTSALVNDENNREESVSKPSRKPFRGIVRPSASRKPFRGTERPPATRRPSRKTVRPSVTRRPFRGPVRPSVTRPFRGTRRPTSTRKPFRGIARPEWAQFHESDRDRQNSPVSTTEVSQGIETDGHVQGNEWDYDLEQEQPYERTTTKETGDSQSETGVLTSAEIDTKDSGAYDTKLLESNQDLLSDAQQQEHDLDLDPSIKEEWVQTSDDSDNTEGIQGRPGINLASSTGQESSDSETSVTRTPGLNTLRLPGRRKPSQRPSLADIIRQTLLASRSSTTLVTVDISSSSSLIRISSSVIAPSRTRIPPGIATSRTADRERVPPGIVRPGTGRDEQTGGLAWPSYNDYDTGNSAPTGEQETDTGGSSWDYGQTGSPENSDGIAYGEDYETGASGPAFSQDYETGTSSPAYYPEYYETGTSTSTEDGTAQDAQSGLSGDQATSTAAPTEQIGDQNAEEGGESDVKQSTSTKGQEVEGQQDKTVEVETAQPVSTTQDPSQLAGVDSDDDSQAPKSNIDVTLSISTSETSQEVSVQHSVSEVSAPADAVSEDDPESESPVELVVGVSTTGGLIADVSEVTTTDKPVPTTESTAVTSATQKEMTENGRLPSKDGDNTTPATSSDDSTPAPAAPSTGDPGRQPSGGAPGRGSVAIAGLLIPTQQKGELNRGVETPGLEQPLLSEDKEQEDKCPRPCQAAINEVCRQMAGEYQCLCRPGFSRARDSDACEPALTYQVRLLLDRVNDIPLQYRPPFGEPSSPEYQQLAGLAAGGLRQNLVTKGPLASRLHAATLMAFKRAADLPGTAPTRPQALMADVMVQITDRESKSFDKDSLQQIVEDSLRRTNYSLSDHQVMVSPLHGDVTVIDFDECQSPEYNDCHEQAFCFNLAGSFTCSCRDGLVDTGVPSLPGRSCSGEYSGCPECSYSGECYTAESGEPACRCHRWYAGQRCQVNLRVLLIALASAGALLAALLCVCCYFCCRRRGRRMAAPPLVFSGPGGLWRHRGSRLHQPVADQRAMLDSSSDTSIPVSPRRRPPSGGRRLLPPLSGGQKPSGPGSRGSQQQPQQQQPQPAPVDGQRPSRFLPRPRHKPDAASGPRSLTSQGGADPSAGAAGRTQPQLMGLLHPADGGRGRTSGGTFRAGRSSRSSNRPEGEPQVSHLPGGRSRSSSGGRRPEPEVSQLPSGRSRSRSSDSLGGPPERLECGTHNFFRARTMSDARSFDEELIEPSVRPVARFDTARSQRSSHAPSSHGYTYEHHTMAERDAASTYVMPETHLFRRAQDSDAQSETSLVEDFPRMDAASTVSSRRGFR